MRKTRLVLAMAISLTLCGCSPDPTGIALEKSRQRSRLFLQPTDAVVEVVDSSGESLVMEDGIGTIG